MKRPTCFRCGGERPIVTRSELATTADLTQTREIQRICHPCRHRAIAESRAADARKAGATGVLALEQLWALPTVDEPSRGMLICSECKNYRDTPVHYYSCENGGKKTWPPT